MKYLTILLAILMGALLCGGVAYADEPVDDTEVVVPPPRKPAPPPKAEPVTAPAPAMVSLTSRAVAVGIGLQWGEGTLSFEGRNYDFSVKGLSVGDLGASSSVALGDVSNLERIEDFAGTYMAVSAGAAAGPGRSTVTMRNEHGVVIRLDADQTGGRLTLGAEGLRVAMR